MRRIMLFDRSDAPLGELSEGEVFELSRTEEVNGEHSMTVTTTRVLEKGWRVVTRDGRGKWREHVVYGTDAKHDSGERPIGTYYCVWSLQHDLQGTRVSKMPGTQTPVPAALALDAALSGTARWARGTVTNSNTGGASMYDTDGWSAMSTLVDTWGGEVDATIEVGTSSVVARKCDLHAEQGDRSAKRRFDFGADLKSVRRIVEDGPLYCRITPRGKGEESESGAYGRKVTIESVNGGRDYLENAAMVELARLPDGNGGWEYPTLEVENSDCETPAELLAWARSVLEESTAPKVTYEVDALQAAAEGVDVRGVSLGDAVQVVDRRFGDGLRLSGRVVAMTVNMLDESDAQLTIGHLDGGLAGLFGSLSSRLSTVEGTVRAMNGGDYTTAGYLSRLLDRLNAEINATGGYTYITEGQGIRTYDRAVSDPLVGAEASAVVEVKGGTVRIANTKTAAGDWEWKTVFTSGHVAAEVVTAAKLVSGFIGNAGGAYWDLDNNALSMPATTIVDDRTVAELLGSVDDSAAVIRPYRSGVLACRQGNSVGALVNADGSFDVVPVSWDGGTPTAGEPYSTFGPSSANIGRWGDSAGVGDAATVSLFDGSGYLRLVVGETRDSMAIGSGALALQAHDDVTVFSSTGTLRVSSNNGEPMYVNGARVLVAKDVLYDDPAGTIGTVALSATAKRYTHMRIYYAGTDGARRSEDVYSPNGKSVRLISALWVNSTFQTQVQTRTIMDKSVVPSGNYYQNVTSGGAAGAGGQDSIRVYRVEAWNE